MITQANRPSSRGRAICASGVHSSLDGRPLPFLISPRRFFESTRLTFDENVGRVGRRVRGGGANATRRTSASLSRANSRFWNWDRRSLATTTTQPSTSCDDNRSNARSLTNSPTTAVLERSKTSSTRVLLVLTCWPPAPLERENRHCSSCSGTTVRPEMCRPSVTLRHPGCMVSGFAGPAGGRALRARWY
jgi:hypothetical protein